MRTALDTNVLSELLSQEAVAAKISTQLGNCKREGSLIISAVVYAELLAHPQMTESLLAYLLSKPVLRSTTNSPKPSGEKQVCVTRNTRTVAEEP